MCDGCHGCDEDMLPIPAEAFEMPISVRQRIVISVDGAVTRVVSDDRKAHGARR